MRPEPRVSVAKADREADEAAAGAGEGEVLLALLLDGLHAQQLRRTTQDSGAAEPSAAHTRAQHSTDA